MRVPRALAAALAAALPLACKKSAPPPPPPPVVPACVEATPCVLTPGAAALTGMITAVGQVDTYTVEIPASRAGVRTILQLQVRDGAAATPVKLVSILESPDGGTVIASRGPTKTNGPQLLTGNFLIAAPGVYRLIVRDVLSQATDKFNGYSIQAAILDDPDALFEPDDTLATARPIGFSQAPASLSGSIAFAGDTDLMTFTVAPPGAIAHLTAAQAVVVDSPLRLHLRLLLLAGTDLVKASNLVEVTSTAAGAGLVADKTRFLPAGNYAIALDDAAGTGADARPAAAWSVTLQSLPDPDPNEQNSRNDQQDAGTPLPLTGAAVLGAIGSQGDRDWYQIALPAAATMKILEVRLDPKLVNTDLMLAWTVADTIDTPTVNCDAGCGGPALLCNDETGKCALDMHGYHVFAPGETTPQVLRLRQLGPARFVYVTVFDYGDARASNKLYSLTARFLDDPDTNEIDGNNDSRDAGTPVLFVDAGALTRYATNGQISTWDYIDGRTTAELRAEVDWYQMTLPPRDLGEPDGGCQIDGGLPDGGVLDGGLPDGGCPLVIQPRPDYGIALHWNGPSDGTYRLGLQATVPTPDGGLACRFSIDERFAHAADGGGYVYGNDPADQCFCLPAANAERDQLWLRVEAAHRPTPPGANSYSDLPYSVSLELTPRALQPLCDGGCAPLLNNSPCPGQ